jgi:5,10-methylenetetrahydromethanopterin reductase
MPESQLNRHGISSADLAPILEAFGAGQVDKAIELTSSELADNLSISGTPEECEEKLRENILSTGINHIVYAICDPFLVKAFSGMDVPNVPDTTGQLRLLAERVNPNLG